ncbi:nitrate/sulfonate/bicarbonate ABC transporter ATP-binding protein [Streptococcus pneumoniae]|nr:nitrate/sulfonate/bicarbonate ABC transporter ATP-binding protein [Streptococcus pneumoniae]
MTEIRLEHVSYAYGQERILEDINLQVTSGEVVSILGPSGVGKTTLFNLIAGILEVQSGRIVCQVFFKDTIFFIPFVESIPAWKDHPL